MRHGGNLRHMECARDKRADLQKDKIKLEKGEAGERRTTPLKMGSGGVIGDESEGAGRWN